MPRQPGSLRRCAHTASAYRGGVHCRACFRGPRPPHSLSTPLERARRAPLSRSARPAAPLLSEPTGQAPQLEQPRRGAGVSPVVAAWELKLVETRHKGTSERRPREVHGERVTACLVNQCPRPARCCGGTLWRASRVPVSPLPARGRAPEALTSLIRNKRLVWTLRSGC